MVWLILLMGGVTVVLIAATLSQAVITRRQRASELEVLSLPPMTPDGRDLSAPSVLEVPSGARIRIGESQIQALADGRIDNRAAPAPLTAGGDALDARSAEHALGPEILRELAQIPPLPRAVTQVLQELQSVGSSAKSVASIVSTEPVLSATLLRIVNSAAMGLRREIITVQDAVTYLGFSMVRSLVLRLKLGSLLRADSRAGSKGETRGYNTEALWVHSLAVGQVAEYLARRVGGTEPALALTIGLLHDLGKLAINSRFPKQVQQLWDTTNVPAGESFLGRERRLFGADHAFIGGFLASQWKLPADLVEAIRLHHLGDVQAVNALRPDLRRAVCIVHVANQLVKYAHVYCEDMEIDIVQPQLLTALGLPPNLEQVMDARVQQLARLAIGMRTDTPAPAGPVPRGLKLAAP